jgi:antitoxin (DNA-binding transcriptional repressor) of toxin-antitoxin stability system
MKSISKRELNQNTAQVLEGVGIGEPVIVTERGVPRWRIESLGGELAIGTLVGSLRISKPATRKCSWRDITPYEPKEPTQVTLDYLREDKI